MSSSGVHLLSGERGESGHGGELGHRVLGQVAAVGGGPHRRAWGIATGISAADRAATIELLWREATRPEDLVRPGHMFPLIADDGGVLVRPGHTEAAVDLACLAGLRPAGVICEIADASGVMMRGERLRRFSRRNGLPQVSIDELREYLAG